MIKIQCVPSKKYKRFHDIARFPNSLPLRPLVGEFIYEVDNKGNIQMNPYPIIAISHVFINNEYVMRLHLCCPVQYSGE